MPRQQLVTLCSLEAWRELAMLHPDAELRSETAARIQLIERGRGGRRAMVMQQKVDEAATLHAAAARGRTTRKTSRCATRSIQDETLRSGARRSRAASRRCAPCHSLRAQTCSRARSGRSRYCLHSSPAARPFGRRSRPSTTARGSSKSGASPRALGCCCCLASSTPSVLSFASWWSGCALGGDGGSRATGMFAREEIPWSRSPPLLCTLRALRTLRNHRALRSHRALRKVRALHTPRVVRTALAPRALHALRGQRTPPI